MTTSSTAVETRLAAHVQKLGVDHPPIDPTTVDYTVHRPALVRERFGAVLDYMARAELEVERNVLELTTLLPDPPEVDKTFYTDVWGPQEAMHGLILDELQVRIGRPPAVTDLTTISPKIRALGTMAHLGAVQDVLRMLYYLTGMTTERSAVLAYHHLHDGLVEMGERAVASTVVTPIRRQEPGHYAFYQMSARRLWDQLSTWQRWLVRRLRVLSYQPVGANSQVQRAQVGEMMLALGVGDDESAADFAEQVSRVERDLLWAQQEGLRVPPYIAGSFRQCVELARAGVAAPADGRLLAA